MEPSTAFIFDLILDYTKCRGLKFEKSPFNMYMIGVKVTLADIITFLIPVILNALQLIMMLCRSFGFLVNIF